MSKVWDAVKPALWPEGNIAQILLMKDTPPPKPTPPKPYVTSVAEHVGVVLSLVPKLPFALWMYFAMPTMAEAATLDLAWILPIVLRDLAIMFVVVGGWDFLLYGPVFREKMRPYKFNPKYPPWSQLKHDILWTTSATILASLQDVMVFHFWATGRWAVTLDFWANPIVHVLWLVSMPYWRIVHFHFLHRGMHPWRTTTVPDLGKWLYRQFHSLHHKSYNPTAFSGISMHPVESIGYFSAALIPCIWGVHPIIYLLTKVDLAMGAQIGHDGFNSPGGASYVHYLHHKMFEVNYSEPYVPLDWLMGTFGDGTKKAPMNDDFKKTDAFKEE